MKSFKKFLEEQAKTQAELDAARQKLANIPVLSDDEMRQQNPKATAAFEKEVRRKKLGASVKTIKTPEGSIVTNMPSGSSTPEEILARLENKPETPSSTSRPSTGNKPKISRNITKPSGRLTSSSPKPVSAAPKVTSSSRTQAWQGPTQAAPKPTPAPAAQKPSLSSSIKDVLKSEREAKAAQKAALRTTRATAATKLLGNLGRTAGIIGSGIEAKRSFEKARREGSSVKRSIGAGAAAGLGGYIGAGLGATAGSVLGIPGAIGGSVAGYEIGKNLGTAAYKAVTGDPYKKLTTKGVLTNIRKAVPYQIRSQVPAGARKAFRDLVTQTGKTYGNWSRSQQQGGNK